MITPVPPPVPQVPTLSSVPTGILTLGGAKCGILCPTCGVSTAWCTGKPLHTGDHKGNCRHTWS